MTGAIQRPVVLLNGIGYTGQADRPPAAKAQQSQRLLRRFAIAGLTLGHMIGRECRPG